MALSVYLVEDGHVVGPFDGDALKVRLGSQAQAAVTQVWMQGMADWAPASQVPALAALVASLPLDLPFDAAKYVIGSWQSDDHPLVTDTNAVMGRETFSFNADGTFTGTAFGSRYTVRTKPGVTADKTELVTESFVLNNSMTGSFSVRAGKDGFFIVALKGKLTNHSSDAENKPRDWQRELELMNVGPIHMRTRYGVNYHKVNN